ncbi:MAG: helix-turn-helix transcriptional regulator [Cyanobacteria bacterium SZAS LIN-3]|nr:helix-turn-helix transcriptional regulator [Cyanobacteria bacterium SZAS LIN-3]
MPYRSVVSSELAKLFNALSHPMRVRIIEELRKEDMPVAKLVEILAVPQAAVSQQLSVLRNNRLVAERREGRNVFYHLRNAQLANWIMEGVSFISPDPDEVQNMIVAIQNAKSVWPSEAEKPTKPKAKKNKKDA